MALGLEPPQRPPTSLQSHWFASERFDWRRVILDSVPPLRHDRGSRLPLILWKDGASPEMSQETVRELLARGIVPHCETAPAWVDAARTIQKVGGPVVLLEGASGPFPYDLLGEDPQNWDHDFGDIAIPQEWREMPCPSLFYPWAIANKWLEDRLANFRSAGVSVHAILMDWETPPFNADFGACLACSRCRSTFADVLHDHEAFALHMRQLWQSLVASTIGGAARKVFPQAISGNWACYYSTRELPVYGWANTYQGELTPGLLNASVPIAYGMTDWITPWQNMEQTEVDAAYAHLLLRQITADTANRRQFASWLQSFPWFARWVPVEGFDDAPAMSRSAYREVLRHSWLRGIDGMQIFNTHREGAELQAVHEVVDAQQIYDEMLFFRAYLEKGEPLNLQVPQPHPLPLWSGLRLGNYAVIRAIGWAGEDAVSVNPWSEREILLPAPASGATYLLKRGEPDGQALPVPPPNKR